MARLSTAWESPPPLKATRSILTPITQFSLIPSHKAVLREIHRAGSATRIDLTKTTGLSTQSLTRITKELIDDGLIVEGERRITGRGQPAIYLSIRPSCMVSFGLVIEHDQITCVASELGGEQLVYLKRHGDFQKADAALAEAGAMLATAIDQAPPKALALGVGVSVSGFFVEEGSRRFVSRNDIEGWRAIDLAQDLPLPIPMPVFVENDGRAAAIGQAVDGIGRGLESFFLVLMTKGIGGGFVYRGELIRGSLGNAGDLTGFVPRSPSTKRPTAESLANFLRQKWSAPPTDTQIDAALREDDPAILEWLVGAGQSLQEALAVVAGLLDPKAIILAGRLSPAVRQALADRVKVETVNFAGFQAPPPMMLVDPKTDCLSVGATALPVAAYLYSR